MENDESRHDPASRTTVRRLLRFLKWGVCLAVLGFVSAKAAELWQSEELRDLHVRPSWLLLSGVVYLLGWLPSVWFWRYLMGSLGEAVSWSDAVRAYYCGHLGKYIPGKATVLIIRAGMLKARGHAASTSAVTATCETLSMMGVGLALGVGCVPLYFTDSARSRLPGWFRQLADRPLLPGVLLAATLVLLLPVLARLLTLVAARLTPGAAERERVGVSTRGLALGIVAFLGAWMVHGLSLGCVLRAMSPADFTVENWGMWTGAVSLATSLGFLAVFAPGGVGVREGLLMAFLRGQASISDTEIVCAAVLLRLVWLLAETGLASLLFLGRRRPRDLQAE